MRRATLPSPNVSREMNARIAHSRMGRPKLSRPVVDEGLEVGRPATFNDHGRTRGLSG
jgi:hypothetical protein